MNIQTAQLGHNSVSFGEMIEADPAVIFREPEALPGLIAEIDAQIAAHAPDLSTESGRKAIASLAYGIAKRKAPIDDAGKDLNEAARKQINAIDAVRRKARDELDRLRDKARQPLNEWEAAEEDRQAKISAVIDRLKGMEIVPAGTSSAQIVAMIEEARAVEIDTGVFQDLAEPVLSRKARLIAGLTTLKDVAAQEEADRAELARLRAEKEARDKAEAEAKEKAEAEAREAERIAEAQKQAAAEAEARVKREAEEALAAERRKTEEAQQALADARRREAEEKAAEERRQAQAAAEEERRAANKRHRQKVMTAAKVAIMEAGAASEDQARAIVTAIVNGAVPHTAISF